MDKEKRAAYDALAGFTGGAVNPFVDAAYERDHVRPEESLSMLWEMCTAGGLLVDRACQCG